MILKLRTIREHSGLIFVLCIAITIRVWLLRWWAAAPFGDVGNFIRIAQALAHFGYPVTDKRLPLYPLLILIVHTILPRLSWETVAIGIALSMSLITLILLYVLAQRLELSKVATVVGLLIFMSYFPFLSYSIRGYADTTFSALLLASMIAALTTRRRPLPVPLGILLGCLALTRYEGSAASAVIVLCLVVSRRLNWRQFAVLIVTGVIVTTPYILLARHTGRSLLPTTYLSQAADSDQGYGAQSWGEWRENYYRIMDRIGVTTWWTKPGILYREARDDLLGWHQHVINQIHEPSYLVGWLAPFGLLLLIRRQQWFNTALVTLPFMAIAAPLAWWAPLVRYDAFVYPGMLLLTMAAFHGLLRIVNRSTTGGTGLQRAVVCLLLFTATAVWLLNATQDTQEKLRKTQHRELANYQALIAARQLPGVVAFEKTDLLTTLSFPPERLRTFTELFPVRPVSPQQQWQVLQQNHVAYVVTSHHLENSPVGTATVVQTFSVEQGNHDTNTATIFALHYSHD